MDTTKAVHILATFIGGILACAGVHLAIRVGYLTNADTADELAASITFVISHAWPYFYAWAKPQLPAVK